MSRWNKFFKKLLVELNEMSTFYADLKRICETNWEAGSLMRNNKLRSRKLYAKWKTNTFHSRIKTWKQSTQRWKQIRRNSIDTNTTTWTNIWKIANSVQKNMEKMKILWANFIKIMKYYYQDLFVMIKENLMLWLLLTAKKKGKQLGFSEELSNTSKKIFLTDQEKIFPDKFADREVLDGSEATFCNKEFIMLIITGKLRRNDLKILMRFYQGKEFIFYLFWRTDWGT